MSSSDSLASFRTRSFVVARCVPPTCPLVRSRLPPDTTAAGQGSCCPVSPSLPVHWAFGGEARASQVPGEPRCVHALLFDPGGMDMPGPGDMSMRPSVIYTTSAPARLTFRGSITRPARSLSTLRRSRLPVPTQDSLPAGGQPLPGGIGYPLGPSRSFTHDLRSCDSKRPGFPGAHKTVTFFSL